MKKLVAVAFAFVLAGCASHANITMPGVTAVESEMYADKSMSYEIMYSQLEPGMFRRAQQQELKPLEEAQLSVASSTILANIGDIIEGQLPRSTTVSKIGNTDFNLVIELIAYDKKGPAYPDYGYAKNFGTSMLTMGLGANSYNLVADFNVTYRLLEGDKVVFEKDYRVEDTVAHKAGRTESVRMVYDYSARLMEKHLMLTMNEFFKSAS